VSADRRKHERVPIQVFAAWSQGHRAGSWTTLDLSAGGLFVETDRELDPRTEVRIRLRSGNDLVLHLLAVVRRTQAPGPGTPGGYGLEFVDLTDADRVALNTLLDRIRAGEIEAETLREPLPETAPAPPSTGRSGFGIRMLAAALLALALGVSVVAAVLLFGTG
jgi:hypothetical protein